MRSNNWVLTYSWLTYTPIRRKFGKFEYNIWNSKIYASKCQEGYRMLKSGIERKRSVHTSEWTYYKS